MNRENLLFAHSILAKGGVILAPTDTVWGLIGDFEKSEAIRKIFALKQAKPRPLALLCSGLDDIDQLNAILPDNAKKIANEFWPGPLTLILKSSSSRIGLVAGTGNTIGVRVPDSIDLLELISEYGKPVAATSANLSGQPETGSFAEITESIIAGVDYLMNCEINPLDKASTVIDCTSAEIKIIREGAIRKADIDRAIGSK